MKSLWFLVAFYTISASASYSDLPLAVRACSALTSLCQKHPCDEHPAHQLLKECKAAGEEYKSEQMDLKLKKNAELYMSSKHPELKNKYVTCETFNVDVTVGQVRCSYVSDPDHPCLVVDGYILTRTPNSFQEVFFTDYELDCGGGL